MRIDPKYFVTFLAVTAVLGALLITFFTVSSQQGRRQDFKRMVLQQDSLRTEKMPLLNESGEEVDSLSVAGLQGSYVVLDFWASWSDFSEGAHRELEKLVYNHPHKLKVIAAVVQDQQDKVADYIQRNRFPFEFVNGTRVFNKYTVPGIPTQLVYNPQGELTKVWFGFADSTRYDSLDAIISRDTLDD